MNCNVLLWDMLTHKHSTILLPSPRLGEMQGNKKSGQEDDIIEYVRFTPDGQRLAIGTANADEYWHIYIYHFDSAHQQLFLQGIFPHGCIDLAISSNDLDGYTHVVAHRAAGYDP